MKLRFRGVVATIDRTRTMLLAIALVASLVVHLCTDLPLGFSFMIFFVGWPVGGTLITIDDDFKGGWNNPDDSVRPDWLEAPFWGQITAGLALSFVGLAYDVGWRSSDGLRCWLVAIAIAFLSATLLTRKWWLLIGITLGFGSLWV
jgi:hypothetical protein